MSSATQNDLQINPDDERIVKRIARHVARNGLRYEKMMMNNIKNQRLNFLRSSQDPLHGYYKRKLTDYLSQIQENGAIVDDFDDDHVATNTSSQVIEPPPGTLRNDIESMASYISSKGGGLVVEKMMTHMNANDARYSFMSRLHPFHGFYQKKLTEYRSRSQPSHDYDAVAAKATEYRVRFQQEGANKDDDADAGRIVLPYMLECRLPKGMNGKEFRTMKITAQFGAWYGNDFWLGFKNRAGFEFTNPTDARFPRFTRFVLEYSQVFVPPKGLQEKVSKSEAYMAAIHDGFFHLLHQWDSLQELKWWEGGVRSMIDWHAQVFANNEELLLPPEPEQKRLKFDEPPSLVPEDQFLAQHPGWCTIRVSVADVDGSEIDIIEITVQSLSENVASFKAKIAQEIRIQPEKQVLFGKAGLLKDHNMSLAHYNVGAREILTLSLCMCGRETDLEKPCCCTQMLSQAFGEMMQSRFN